MRTSLIVLLAVFVGMSAAATTNKAVLRFRRCPVQGQLFFRRCRPCVGTCQNPRPICPLVCSRGCACPLGTVLDTDANACVSPKQCPTVQACRHSDGTEIEDGDSYQPNPCTTCQCDNGKLFCAVQDCAAPPCDDYTVPPGECCPVCFRSCELSNGTSVPHGTNYQPDPCTFCQCNNGNVFCAVQDCAAPPCPDAVPLPGQCCPTQCNKPCVLSNGTEIRDGTSVNTDPCTTCHCSNGKLACFVRDCAAPSCKDYIVPPGECCPVCPNPTLPPKCAAVLCLAVDCPGAVIPKGECCAVCLDEPGPTLPPKCAAVLCLAVDCPGAVIPDGECCAVCPKPPKPTRPPKCAAVTCLAVDCLGAMVPKGECCAVCPNVCEYNGQVYQPGESFPSSDGCNKCFCSESGFVGCTKRACISKLVCPKPTGFGICVDLCVPGFTCGPGQKCCSNGCGHVCTKATNCALVDCAPTPCDFPGGVIIPAGEDECCPTCGCMSGGTTYRVGESFPAGDGCNTCSCTSSGVRCTLIACKEPEA